MADEALHERLPALAWLWNARLQRIDSPSPGLFALTLFHQGERLVLLIWVEPTRRGLGSSPERPKGAPASAFVQRLRSKLENARLTHAHWLVPRAAPQHGARALSLTFTRAEHQETALVDFDRDAPSFILLAESGRPLGASDERALRARWPDRSAPFALGRGPGVPIPSDPTALEQAASDLLEASQRSSQAGLLRDLRQRTQAALKRAERKTQAIRGDLERVQLAPRLRREADVLLCHLHTVPRGQTQVRLLDESVEPPEWLELKLDPTLDAQHNAQQRYQRARKLERGTDISQDRLDAAERSVAALRAFLATIDASGGRDDFDAQPLLERAAELELGVSAPGKAVRKRAGPQMHVPYRTFLGSAGQTIFVGKGAADNDALTLTVARPHDHWLHARGVQGAHVVIPRDRSATLAPELLIDAAHLAAHFSDLRGEPSAEIQHTERRYLRKPKGAAPGAINVDREKVLLLRVEPARLERLLASERRPNQT
ncbi:MAG: NFACT family protein [Myxococcales bacterium]